MRFQAVAVCSVPGTLASAETSGLRSPLSKRCSSGLQGEWLQGKAWHRSAWKSSRVTVGEQHNKDGSTGLRAAENAWDDKTIDSIEALIQLHSNATS